MNRFFNLYSNCIPVKGSEESIIVDLQNTEHVNVPNLLLEVLKKTRTHTVSEIKNFFNNDLNEGIDNYFNYLVDIDYGFFLENVESFPELNLEWHSPFKVNSAILEINEDCKYDFNAAIKELSSLACFSIQIRINNSDVDNIISGILDATRKSRIRNVEIFLPESLYDENYLKYLDDIENRIKTFVIHSVKDEVLTKDLHENSKYYIDKKLIFTSKAINSSTVDNIKKENFIINMEFFTEAQQYNVALNRKVCIDNDGNFKNFLAHKSTHGNFRNKRIAELIQDSEFTRKWFISNDNIEVCKDCQFRYICFNNSDIEFDGSSWKKINKCPFDPYTNEWKAESKHSCK
ncbi:grasp-with-spasm system SPASM domain peptide maturase [Chryseobacterium pennae]|uniref:Grasp-with-spasm system SPASM domain peptide maturase n=1 Tax=Chryseobacterium pennae TaxID=2258962 RepID=A0A3D9C4L1_9FLAO|nr:grasp-with-spasm system SPASM domain peptide maturase [Chryseobacterium pennae]REC60482.1 grasp-with-spasm system SPASM domain peptide maturase [Chryseobacterium pennae]